MIAQQEIELLKSALQRLAEGYEDMPAFTAQIDEPAIAAVLQRAAERMHDNYPYYHPLYAGQMLKPPHAVARIAYAMSLWVNPNNHALDGGRASSALEKECVKDLGAMFGWDDPLGHLSSGGTMANLEALWVAGRLLPGKKIVASDQSHYTHKRISDVLGLPFAAVRTLPDSRMDVTHLEELLKAGDVGTVVATMGNTGFGAVDPLPDILELAQRYDVRVHADSAYGGYFVLADALSGDTQRAYQQLVNVDSIVIDPHKHGLQPYGCGCILFKDPSVGRFYKHDSPYTYFSSAELHLGEVSLECSRAGASAVALWATQELFPLQRGGQRAAELNSCLHAARDFYQRLLASDRYAPLFPPELDIVVYYPKATTASAVSDMSRAVFAAAAKKNLHLAMINVPRHMFADRDLEFDQDTVTCLRSVLMKPEHADWIDNIMAILAACSDDIR